MLCGRASPEVTCFLSGDSFRIHLDAAEGAGRLLSSPARMLSCMAIASCFWCSVSSVIRIDVLIASFQKEYSGLVQRW
jgi:hypothetical protein